MRPRIISKRTGTRQGGTVDSKISPLRYPGKIGQTILSLLQKVARTETLPFKDGVYVRAINGVSGSSTKGWTFSINGRLVRKSADSVKTSSRDKIEWRFIRLKQGEFML